MHDGNKAFAAHAARHFSDSLSSQRRRSAIYNKLGFIIAPPKGCENQIWTVWQMCVFKGGLPVKIYQFRFLSAVWGRCGAI
jgi:hypothetical protein